ncbi:hypothetical protein GCM10010156_02150 [Planobispora rosea]|uniref:Uncharacterized protein n=1 Tax=Planobispora rosea TaxID=35762 RepID=A0A8J3RYA6_PLARO|nr:hypothetical protein [Planobispora rosea]GGS47020.1 hypothetical protein GCM10010156_02150 [Planobispora rosea]GIH82272.1 hypothetical protein Pro02_06800 [Planobispora rosea]
MPNLPLAVVLLASAVKLTPSQKAERRARRRRFMLQLRLAVQKEKAERAERHATRTQSPRRGEPRSRRPSRR